MIIYVLEYFYCLITDQLQAHITGMAIKHFGVGEVKEWQLLISSCLEGRDTLVVQPTGSGKNLCFQLVPFINGKMTIVLTPTISQMKDQCCNLQEKGVPATYTGSSQSDPHIDDKIRNGEFKIIFITPEKIFNSDGFPSGIFCQLMDEGHIGLVAIDEAHLINSWKNFRYISYKLAVIR